MKKFHIIVHRYNPENGKKSIEPFSVPFDKDLTVLDAINTIKYEQQASLSYRWSCRMGLCGSCGATVNGRPVLMCSTFCRDLKQPIVIEPMKNFPVVKDLVVDTDSGMEKMRQAMPYTDLLTRRAFHDKELDQEKLQTPKQRAKLEQTSQCIKCFLCYSACPVYGLNKNFVGPAAGALAYRYSADSHDQIKNERMGTMTNKDGIWDCSFVGECSVVCPKSVDPAVALQKMKISGVIHIAKSILKKS